MCCDNCKLLKDELTEARELVHELFHQACWLQSEKMYCHGFMDCYEYAQKYLIKHKLIEARDCIDE